MQKAGLILLLIGASFLAKAQVAFKTVVTNGPVVVGETFSVQYILENIDKDDEFYPPDFKNFRFVAGPNIYEGTAYGTEGAKKIKNIVYSLVALKPGTVIVPGARAKAGDRYINSEDVQLQVISRAEASKRALALQDKEGNTDYFLRPGENPQQKIRDNLFLKVMVDRKSCFVGEPVTATFKLYSRLISRSDIVKNPGFYGFTVFDVVGLNDKQAGEEVINGKKFDVHTVRKVQLYPLQAGSFTIDPMEVTNQVEFSRSVVYKKKEQEITEGVQPQADVPESVNSETYESNIHSEPVKIRVNPSPAKNQPADYGGATGHFSITASVDRNEFARNEAGRLTVTITGKGNFTQLGAPAIHWPDSLEGFEPEITDSLDKSYSPLKGTRVFHYSFVSAKPGEYIIPVLSFSFFDPDSATYKTVSTRPITISVSNQEKTGKNLVADPAAAKQTNRFIPWLIAIVLLAGAGILFTWLSIKKRRANEKTVTEKTNQLPAVATLMKPAQDAITAGDKFFYATCQQCAWNFFTVYFGLSGSNMNNRYLEAVMRQKGVDEKSQQEIIRLLQECETGSFTGAVMETNKKELVENMTGSLERISRFA